MLDLQNYDQADEDFLLTSSLVLQLSRNAYEIFISSEPNEKRQLLKFLLQNCLLDGEKLKFNLKQPFQAVLDCAQNGNWQGLVDKFRTINWKQVFTCPDLSIAQMKQLLAVSN